MSLTLGRQRKDFSQLLLPTCHQSFTPRTLHSLITPLTFNNIFEDKSHFDFPRCHDITPHDTLSGLELQTTINSEPTLYKTGTTLNGEVDMCSCWPIKDIILEEDDPPARPQQPTFQYVWNGQRWVPPNGTSVRIVFFFSFLPSGVL